MEARSRWLLKASLKPGGRRARRAAHRSRFRWRSTWASFRSRQAPATSGASAWTKRAARTGGSRSAFGPRLDVLMAGSPGLVIHDAGESPVTVYRVVRSENLEDPVFVNSLRSHSEMKAEPRHVEKRAASLHMGLSVFLMREQATETARKWPAI